MRVDGGIHLRRFRHFLALRGRQRPIQRIGPSYALRSISQKPRDALLVRTRGCVRATPTLIDCRRHSFVSRFPKSQQRRAKLRPMHSTGYFRRYDRLASPDLYGIIATIAISTSKMRTRCWRVRCCSQLRQDWPFHRSSPHPLNSKAPAHSAGIRSPKPCHRCP